MSQFAAPRRSSPLPDRGDGGNGGGVFFSGNGILHVEDTSIGNNVAGSGGGICAQGTGSDAELVIGANVTIAGNFASVAGGAIHVRAEDSIASGSLYARANLWHAVLDDNAAPQGAAVQVQGSDTAVLIESAAMLAFNIGPLPAGAAPCPSGAPCGRIAGNVAEDANGQPMQGAVLYLQHDTVLQIGSLGQGVRIAGNRGGRLIESDSGDDHNPVELRNVLIADNQVTSQLVRASGGRDLLVHDATVAGNLFGGANPTLFSTAGHGVALRRSILWQPGAAMLTRSGGALATENLIVSEYASLPAAAST